MANPRAKVAVVQMSGHEKVVRSYIEMRALYEAFAKARKVAGPYQLTGSTSYWDDMRSKVENHKRQELRKIYEKEVRKKLIDVLSKCPTNGIGPYVDYMCWLNQQTLVHRRQLDSLITEDLEYARRDEKLFGILGRLAVITKLGADITLSILGAKDGASNAVGLGYSFITDSINTIADSKDADVWCFELALKKYNGTVLGIATSPIEATFNYMVEEEAGAMKTFKWAVAIESIAQALVDADESWSKFN